MHLIQVLESPPSATVTPLPGMHGETLN